MKKHGKKLVDELCNYLGQDLDHPMCRELLEHVNECPECRKYIETVKLTVSLYRDSSVDKPVPEHVKNQVFQALDFKRSNSG